MAVDFPPLGFGIIAFGGVLCLAAIAMAQDELAFFGSYIAALGLAAVVVGALQERRVRP